jgi:zinc metalloprotease ZmpB
MAFEITPNVTVEYDEQGVARHLEHISQPYYSPEKDLRGVAADYVAAVSDEYALVRPMLEDVNAAVGDELAEDEGPALRLAEEKSVMETTVISYQQTYLGLPVWEAGVAVVLQDNPPRVTSSSSTVHADIDAKSPPADAPFLPEGITPAALRPLLGLEGGRGGGLTINGTRLLVYRYDSLQRFDPEIVLAEEDHGGGLHVEPPTLPLPPVPDRIEEDRHYVVTEVLFSASVKGWGEPINWRSFVEPETGGVLYLRAFVTAVDGAVYSRDPLTKTGDATITPASPAATLDAQRDTVALQGLTTASPQTLMGQYVQLVDISAPTVAGPTSTGNFVYSVPTDNFAAVNAYHHCDALFRMVAGMGFTISSYFNGTTFPVRVDHRATIGTACPAGACVNAQAPGNATGTGSDGFRFALQASGQPVGIACDWRVVLHEFGHALLWDSVNSPNFGFAHSAGDSLGAILNDPGSHAPDRFLTFPWTVITRRHDRPVASWAWGGPNDVGGYSSEQILSTTLFRFYRSIGGDSTRLNMQRLAARYSTYLIVRAIGSLATSPITPTPMASVFATALQTADVTSASFEGQPGGAYAKVMRWAFERQGLYQPPGAPVPVTTVGAPPDIDVYIDDGRQGEYPYQEVFWENQDIWNRLNPDAGFAHETPIVGRPNFLYVKVKNRGTQTATNVAVRCYHCRPATGLVWPADWVPTTTPELPVGAPIVPGGTVLVGPFEWTPTVVGHQCLLATVTTPGDLSNIDSASGRPCAAGPTPHWRLVPYDNNIGQRNVAPVAGRTMRGLIASFKGRRFWAQNPFEKRVKMALEVVLPPLLEKRGWKLQLAWKGTLTLNKGESRLIRTALKPGNAFRPAELKGGQMIRILAKVEGRVVGGLSYLIDPRLAKPPAEK